MTVSGETSRDLLTDLAGRVLERSGLAADGAATLGGELYDTIRRAAGGSADPIKVEFHAGAGRLQVVVSSPAGEIWRASRTKL